MLAWHWRRRIGDVWRNDAPRGTGARKPVLRRQAARGADLRPPGTSGTPPGGTAARAAAALPAGQSAGRACSDGVGASDTQPPSYATETTEAVAAECYKLAFGVARFDYQITGDHAAVLERVDEAAHDAVHHHEYFPRRPMLLPKLLQTLNDSESTRQSLVRLILEDPALAGSVLQRANSAYYRNSREPVDSLERAVVVLGAHGLRSLVATAILQPVFQLPKGYFDSFATITWEQAHRSAMAAEACANASGEADPLAAQLLGLLAALARIVLFRLTMERYRERPNLLPRAEVFIEAMRTHAAPLAGLVAASWELSDASIGALEQQAHRTPPLDMSPLARAVYFGNLGGALAMLEARGAYSAEGAQAMLITQGLTPAAATTLRHAARCPD